MQSTNVERSLHGHHQVAAAVFVGSLILGSAMILSAELIKPERFEFHPGVSQNTYTVFDRSTGRAVSAEINSKNPTASLGE